MFDLDTLHDGDATEHVCGEDRYRRLLVLRAQTESLEPNPDMTLVEKCAAAESERRYGKGVKTLKDRQKAAQTVSAM